MHFGTRGYTGGGERYPLNLARGLLAADSRVHVDLVAVGDQEQRISLQPRLDLHTLPVTLRAANPLDCVSEGLVEVLQATDLVHVHQAFTFASQVAILTAKFLGLPLVVTDHGGTTNQIDRDLGYLALVDLVILYSEFAAGQVIGGRRRVTIPGGVDDRFFRPAIPPAQREFILFTGRVLPHKGVDRLLCALPRDLPCVVAGRHYDDQYARYVRALGATRDVRFIEDADDLALRELYQRAWVTVMPSVHRDAWGRSYQAPELMGFAALESMACGTPTLVSSAGALPEFVRDGDTGFVFSSLQELREHAVAVATGMLDAGQLGRNARALVEAEYSLEAVGSRVWDAYTSLLEEAPA
jgi:glycosyltransferase involved in cell wall biosynthesis